MNFDYTLVEKESISSLHFPSQEVLLDNEEILKRDYDLERALFLGNLEHSKIKIFFEDDTSRKMVETTIWGLTKDRVILKQGIVIPTQRIVKAIL
jgi:hypothetical protein